MIFVQCKYMYEYNELCSSNIKHFVYQELLYAFGSLKCISHSKRFKLVFLL